MLLAISSRADSYVQFLTVLLLFVFVLFITFLTTRWIANYQKSKICGGNIEIIETTRVTSNKYLQIVRAGNKYVLIAVGKDEIHMLTELSAEELTFQKENSVSIRDFSKILAQATKQKEKEKE